MKKVLFILAFVGLFSSLSYAQSTLYDGWISFASSYLGNNEYQYDYTWGASSTLSQEEINNLFPYDIGYYTRVNAGIGTMDFLFDLVWSNPVDILWMSTLGTEFTSFPTGRTSLHIPDIIADWHNRYMWNTHRSFSFRTKGYTSTQDIGLFITYFGAYHLKPGYNNRPVQADVGGGNLRVTGSFTPVPEPATLILLGSGLLGIAGANGLRRKIKK